MRVADAPIRTNRAIPKCSGEVGAANACIVEMSVFKVGIGKICVVDVATTKVGICKVTIA